MFGFPLLYWDMNISLNTLLIGHCNLFGLALMFYTLKISNVDIGLIYVLVINIHIN